MLKHLRNLFCYVIRMKTKDSHLQRNESKNKNTSQEKPAVHKTPETFSLLSTCIHNTMPCENAWWGPLKAATESTDVRRGGARSVLRSAARGTTVFSTKRTSGAQAWPALTPHTWVRKATESSFEFFPISESSLSHLHLRTLSTLLDMS